MQTSSIQARLFSVSVTCTYPYLRDQSAACHRQLPLYSSQLERHPAGLKVTPPAAARYTKADLGSDVPSQTVHRRSSSSDNAHDPQHSVTASRSSSQKLTVSSGCRASRYGSCVRPAAWPAGRPRPEASTPTLPGPDAPQTTAQLSSTLQN